MPGFEAMNPQGAPVNFQQAGQFQQTLAPQQQQTPPSTPQELEQRKSGWQEFITKLQTDPAMRQAALLTATTMMRGPDMGETMGNSFGRALQVGTLAHGFLQGNQTQQSMELQKLEEQKRLNQSAIAQNEAQTQGLLQSQGFEQELQPGKVQAQGLKNASDQFTVDNQPTLLQDQLLNSQSDRAYKRDLGTYRKKLGDKAASGAGPKTPAGVALFERQKQALMASNPIMAGEDPLDYQGRIEGMVLDYNRKPPGGGNPNAVRVQALTQTINNTDPSSKEYQDALSELGKIGKGAGTANPGTTPPPSSGKAAFDAANAAAKAAGKPTFVGPDGQTYKVK